MVVISLLSVLIGADQWGQQSSKRTTYGHLPYLPPWVIELTSPSGGQRRILCRLKRQSWNPKGTVIGERTVTTFTPSQARILQAICAFLYGNTYILTKVLQESISPALLSSLRFTIASLCFVPVLTSYSPTFKLVCHSVLIGIWCAVAFILQSIAIESQDTSKVAFITSLNVVIVPLLDSISARFQPANHSNHPKRSYLQRYLGPILAIAGVCFLEMGKTHKVP